jgi:hypothetical protein
MDNVAQPNRPQGNGDGSIVIGEAGSTPASPSRVRLIVAAVCAVAAIALIAFVFTSGGGKDQVTLSAPTATLAPADRPVATTAVPDTTAATIPPSTVAPLSPLAAQLGEQYSTEIRPIVDLPVPVALRIDTIKVNTDLVLPVGVDDKGEFAVPEAKEVGWYQYGQRPTQSGATVLAAHVSWKKQSGVFARLGTLEPGSEIFVTLSDGSEKRYVALERTMYDKQELPYDRIWTREGPEVLVLITCGGDFNPEIRRYRENIVVYAVPQDA